MARKPLPTCQRCGLRIRNWEKHRYGSGQVCNRQYALNEQERRREAQFAKGWAPAHPYQQILRDVSAPTVRVPSHLVWQDEPEEGFVTHSDSAWVPLPLRIIASVRTDTTTRRSLLRRVMKQSGFSQFLKEENHALYESIYRLAGRGGLVAYVIEQPWFDKIAGQYL